MTTLYLTHPGTLEFAGSRQLTSRDLNPKYSPETHDLADKYIYNPLTSSLTAPPEAGDNQIPVLVDGVWELVDDYRLQTFWDTGSQEKHMINELRVSPDAGWTNLEPPADWYIWDGTAWQADFARWLGSVVRPGRNEKLVASDIYMMADYPITAAALDEWKRYRQALRDLPATLTAVTAPVPWPVEPV